MAAAAISAAACGGESTAIPTAPTPTSVPRFALSGVVRADGGPISGAQVALLRFNGLTASTTTDSTGSYRFPAVENVSFSGALVSVSKAEYFTDTKYILMSQDQQLSFDLQRATFVTVGQFVQSPVGTARCASLGYGGMGGATCQRFGVVVPVSGMLEVTVSSVSAPLPFDVTVLRPDGTIGVYTAAISPVQVTLRVSADMTYQIDVVHIDPATHMFELATTLR